MSVGAGMVVPAIPLAPPRVSLLSSVDVVEFTDSPTDGTLIDATNVTAGPDTLRWVNGIEFLPEGCSAPTNPYWWECPDPGGAAPGFTKDPPAPEAIVKYRPYDIWVAFRCGAQSIQNNDYVARATRAMAAFQSQLIANELWTGAKVATPASFDNDFLTNGATPLNGGVNTPWVTALAELEQALATCQPGQVGVIHAQPRTVMLWLQNGLLNAEPSGRRLRTPLGTIVVPDAGYPGTGTGLDPATVASAWAYGTSMVRVWLGPIRRLLDESSQTVNTGGLNAAEIDRSVNTVAVRVERTVAAVWDECCQVGVRVNHTTAL